MLYFLKEGHIDLVYECKKKHELVILKELQPGECFGEIPFFIESTAEENAISRSFSTVYKISRANFLILLKEFPNDYVTYLYKSILIH